MAKNEKIEAKSTEITVDNFDFELSDGASIDTNAGLYSSRESKIQGGPKKGQVPPLRGLLRGIVKMTTALDRENASKRAEAVGEDPEEAALNAPPGEYFEFELTRPTIVVLNGQVKVQKEGLVRTKITTKLDSLRDFAMDPIDIHEWEIFPTGEQKVAGNKHSMHQYKLTFCGKMTRDEYAKSKSEALMKVLSVNGKNQLPASAS